MTNPKTAELPFAKQARPDAAFLNPGIFPFKTEIAVRFQDLDPLGHVNNVAMVTMFEEARVHFNQYIRKEEDFKSHRVLIGSQSVQYLGETFYGNPVHMFLGIGHIGRSSWNLRCLGFQKDRLVMSGLAVLVCTSDQGGQSLSDGLMSKLKERRLGLPAS